MLRHKIDMAGWIAVTSRPVAWDSLIELTPAHWQLRTTLRLMLLRPSTVTCRGYIDATSFLWAIVRPLVRDIRLLDDTIRRAVRGRAGALKAQSLSTYNASLLNDQPLSSSFVRSSSRFTPRSYACPIHLASISYASLCMLQGSLDDPTLS